MMYLKKALREIPQILYKCPLELKIELIPSATSQNTFLAISQCVIW